MPFFDYALSCPSRGALRFPLPSKSGWRLLRVAAGFLVGLVAAFPGFGSMTVLDPAQVSREFTQRSWQKKDGLPDNQVQALLQTRDGFLWIGTSRGLARFDGLKFVVFDHLNTPEMPNDNCKSLAEDTERNLWIATGDGLLRWRDGTFKRFTRNDGLTPVPGQAHDGIKLVYADRRGGVWIVQHTAVDLLRNGRITHCYDAERDSTTAVCSLYQDPGGHIWTGRYGGVVRRFNEQTGRFEAPSETQPEGMNVSSIQDDGAGGLWFLCITGNGRAGWIYRLRGGKFEKVSDQIPSGFQYAFLCADRRGRLWMPSDQGGVHCFLDSKFIRYPFPQEIRYDQPLCLMCGLAPNRV